MQPTRSYLICATPRSGSTLLCEALENTGIAGHPKEYFEALKTSGIPRRPQEYFTSFDNQEIMDLLGDFSRFDTVSPSPATLHATYADYLAYVMKEGTTSNGIFGAKVMWGHFGDFISNLRDIPAYTEEMPVPTLLATLFPDLHYIQVIRRDKVRQALSLWKAIQTWTWREEDESLTSNRQNGELHTHKKLRFHYGAIDHLIQQIEEQEQAWQHYFDAAAIEPFRVVYEDLAANYEDTALQLLYYLDIPLVENVAFAERRMKRQSDALSEKWLEWYYALSQHNEEPISLT